MVERLFLAVPQGCLRSVVFPDHTHLLFLITFKFSNERHLIPLLTKKSNYEIKKFKEISY